MEGYICKHCGYRHKSKPRECGWCGRECMEKEMSAEELLDNVDEILKNN